LCVESSSRYTFAIADEFGDRLCDKSMGNIFLAKFWILLHELFLE